MLVYDLGEDVEDYADNEYTASEAQSSLAREAIVTASLVAMNAIASENELADQKTREDLAYLPDEIFTSSTVPSLDKSRGKVYLNNDWIKRYTRLLVPVGGVTFIFDFRKAKGVERQRIRYYSY